MSWRPSASLATLQLRARLLARLRAFFAARGVLEVETPSLSPAGSIDPALTSIAARVQALGGARMYLQTSPEFAMKRLLAAGSGDIYQICRVYRDGELGRWHQPEFTMLEWYRVGWDDFALMDEVGALLTEVLEREDARPATVRMSYLEAFERFVGVDPGAGPDALAAALEGRGLAVPATTDQRILLDFALSAAVAPALPRSTLTFIYDFPADQAALARTKPTRPAVAARFEAFFDGIELANGFAELTDAAEQRRRFEAEHAERLAAGHEAPPLDEALLAALEHGLPECAGVAVGVDRLVAAAASIDGIGAAVSFAHAAAAAAPLS
jgi:lysyl-tRNA synthetase class 2